MPPYLPPHSVMQKLYIFLACIVVAKGDPDSSVYLHFNLTAIFFGFRHFGPRLI